MKQFLQCVLVFFIELMVFNNYTLLRCLLFKGSIIYSIVPAGIIDNLKAINS